MGKLHVSDHRRIHGDLSRPRNAESASTKNASDLSNGTAYDGSALLAPDYQQYADKIAAHISTTLGGVAASTTSLQTARLFSPPSRDGHRQKPILTGGDKYIAYPGAAPNLFSQAGYTQSNLNYRPFKPMAAQAENFPLPLPAGSQAKFKVGAPQFHFSFHDLITNVVHGVENVVSVVVDVAEGVIHTLTTDAGHVYQFTINTVEAAAASVAAVLKTVAGKIASAVEWLSYLFDWGDIVANAVTISNTLQGNIGAYSTYLSNGASAATTALNKFLSNIENTIQNAFSSLHQQFDGTSLQSQQQQGNNPRSVYSKNGTNSYTKSQWMNSKVKGGLGAGQTSLTRSVSRTQSNPVPKAVAAVPATLVDTLRTDIEGALSSLSASFRIHRLSSRRVCTVCWM